MMEIEGLQIGGKDLNQRYKGTYVRVSHTGESVQEVTMIREFSEEYVWTSQLRFPHEELKIIQEFPPMGAVNYKGAVHHVLRRPLRQWSRGLSNVVIDDFSLGGSTFEGGLNEQVAKAMFDRVWVPWAEGLEKIKQKQIKSFAINPRYWVSEVEKEPILWRDRTAIGRIMGKKILYFPTSKILQQEVKDDLRRLNEA